MSRTQQPWLKSGLTFCGSCVVSIVYCAVWIGLAASLAVLTWIAIAHELPVPDFMLRRLEAQFDQADFAITFGRARFDPTGQVLLEDVQVRSKRYTEPLLRSRLLYVRRNFLLVLAGRPTPDEIKLEGATLQLPAMLSPSGAAEPIIQDLALVVHHDVGSKWRIDQANGKIGRLRVTLQGELDLRLQPDSGAKNWEERITSALETCRSLVRQIDRLTAFESPAIDVRLRVAEGLGNTAAVVFNAESSASPWGVPITLRQLNASGVIRLDGEGERVVRIRAAANSGMYQQSVGIDQPAAVVNFRYSPQNKRLTPLTIEAVAARVFADDEKVLYPIMRAEIAAWPLFDMSTSANVGNEWITVNAIGQIDEKSGSIHLEGTGDAATINRVLNRHLPRAAPYFVFQDSVSAVADASFGPGWKFASLASRVSAGRLNSRGVMLTSAKGRIDIQGMSFTAYDAVVEMQGSLAKGSYWMDFSNTDYRMLLKGNLTPQKIQGWFNGSWWTDFWEAHFAFKGPEPTADVDVQGQWRDATRTEYFGDATAYNAEVWGGKFERVDARIFLRPQYLDIIRFDGYRASGSQRLGGSLRREVSIGNRDNGRLNFQLKGNIDAETYHGMLASNADEILAPLKFPAPPQVSAYGEIQFTGSRSRPEFKFTAESAAPFSYFEFPIETAKISGSVIGGDLELSKVEFSAVGGKGAGKASVTGADAGRSLGFDFYLNGADLPRAIVTVQEFGDTRSGRARSTPIDSGLIRRVAGGRIDVALSAQGKPGDFGTFSGTGNAAITGADLAEIQLFGLLSQVLSGLSLRFSSLKLDAAHTSFRLDRGHLRFPDLKITGPSAVIDAHGDFAFEGNSLDFTAKFKPFEESRGLFTTAIGIVITPITNIFELKLTGNLGKPVWAIDLGAISGASDANSKLLPKPTIAESQGAR